MTYIALALLIYFGLGAFALALAFLVESICMDLNP